MKRYTKPQVETMGTVTQNFLCEMSKLSVDGSKDVNTGWTRRQELWADEEEGW